MTGLNLSAARIMILFVRTSVLPIQIMCYSADELHTHQDQVFSQQDKKQLIGRIHRIPQKQTCIVYDLVLQDTADEALYAIASGKAEMMAALNGRKIHNLMHQSIETISNPLADVDDEEYMLHNGEPEMEDLFISAPRSHWRIAAGKRQRAVCSHRPGAESSPVVDPVSQEKDNSFYDALESLELPPRDLSNIEASEAKFFDLLEATEPEQTDFYDLLEGMELIDDQSNTIPVEDDDGHSVSHMSHAAPVSDQGASQAWADWPCPLSDDWPTSLEEDNRSLASTTQEDHTRRSSPYEFSNSTIQIGAPTRWVSSNLLGRKRRAEHGPEAPDEPEINVSKRRVAGSAWGVEMRAGRAAALASVPRRRSGLSYSQEKKFTKLEEAESFAIIGQAGGASHFLDQLKAELAAENQARVTTNSEIPSNMDRTQPSSTYRFESSVRSFYSR